MVMKSVLSSFIHEIYITGGDYCLFGCSGANQNAPLKIAWYVPVVTFSYFSSLHFCSVSLPVLLGSAFPPFWYYIECKSSHVRVASACCCTGVTLPDCVSN
jgi:hypothetical protein